MSIDSYTGIDLSEGSVYNKHSNPMNNHKRNCEMSALGWAATVPPECTCNKPVEKSKFLKRVEITNNCWIWRGGKRVREYGSFDLDGKTQLAHRVSYQLFIGEIPTGMLILHKCDVPSCVNPNHLYIGNQLDNMNDATKRKRFPPRIGEGNGRAKLTEKDVLVIRSDFKGTPVSARKLGEKYSVTKEAIMAIIKRKSWKNI